MFQRGSGNKLTSKQGDTKEELMDNLFTESSKSDSLRLPVSEFKREET